MADTIETVYLDPLTLAPLATGGTEYLKITRDSGSIAYELVSPAVPPLDLAKADKITQLAAARDNAIYSSFTSSALGSTKTYTYDKAAYDNFRGEATILSLDTTITSVSWYTVEDAAFVTHTRDQFVQVIKDGASHERSQKMLYYTKEAQVKAATTVAAVGTVAFPKNPNPPSVPAGLAGTAGTTGSGQVTINWTANSDVTMIGGGGYNIYVDGVATAKNTSLVTGTTFTVTGLTAGAHTFSITAVDTDGNESAKCAAVSVTVT